MSLISKRFLIVFAVLVFVSFSASAFGQYSRITTIAGSGAADKLVSAGPALQTPIANPFGIGELSDGSLVICSFDWHVLYHLDSKRQTLKVIAGSGKKGLGGQPDGPALAMEMNQPHELQIDSKGDIYIADTMNHRVAKYVSGNQTWQPLAGTGAADFGGDGGPAADATMNQAYSIALDNSTLFVVDLKNQRLRQIDLSTGVISNVCGTGESKMPVNGSPAKTSTLADPRSVAVDRDNIWIVLRGGNSVWRIDRKTDKIYHVAGTGKKGFSGDGGDAKLATFNGPKGIAVDPGVALYLADTENHAIRRIDLKSGLVTTLVGSPKGEKGFNGDGDQLQTRLLNRPHGVCLLKSGDLVIGDSENHRVRIVTR